MVAACLPSLVGCAHTGRGHPIDGSETDVVRKQPPPNEPIVRHVMCMFEHSRRRWLNQDKAGDRDPEGIWYRAWLKTLQGESVIRDGTFHVEMYRIERSPDNTLNRTLVSDWIYRTDRVGRIGQPGWLGDGYVLALRWATKDIAGSEIEIITTFEDDYGRTARSETYRMRVPKYSF